MSWPRRHHWQAEGLRLRRQPLAWMAFAALFLVLFASAISAGLQARAWRAAAAQDPAVFAERLAQAAQRLPPAGPANATALYQLGRGELGSTRLPVHAGLALGVQRLDVLPARLKASLDSRHVEARDPGPLKNPLLTESGLPGLPAMVALLLPLVALLLCAGLLQEEREQGRLGLLRVQSRHGLAPILLAALGWRLLGLWTVAALATLPALALDPGANLLVALQWLGALAAFCTLWVLLGGVLSGLPGSGAAAMLAALGLWLALTFAVPAGLLLQAQQQAPTPSRLQSIVSIRAAQHDSEDHEQALAQAWYAAHPEVAAQLPAVWPASFVARALDQDLALEPLAVERAESRLEQAAVLHRWSWLSPGLALVLWGEKAAGTDVHSHVRYLQQVEAFEQRWRDFLVPRVMDREGLDAARLQSLPRFQP